MMAARVEHSPTFADRVAAVPRGFKVLPCNPQTKAPLIEGGHRNASRDSDTISMWDQLYPDALVGVTPPGSIVFLDVDEGHQDGVSGFDTLASLGLEIPRTANYATPRGGRHYMLTVPKDRKVRQRQGRIGGGVAAPGVDSRTSDGYVCWAPANIGSAIEDGRVIAFAPEWLLEPTDTVLPAVVSVPPGLVSNDDLSAGLHRPLTTEQVAACLAGLSPDCTREDWIKVGMALHSNYEGSGEGFDLWNSWSAQAADRYPGEDQIRRQWDLFRRDGVGAGTLIHMAREAGVVLPAEPAGPANPQTAAAARPSTAAKPVTSVTLTSALDVKMEPITWLWPEWLARGKLTILAGQAGTGKTTLALGLAATVTAGGRWPDGAEFRQPGNVLVWSGEDDPADTLLPRLTACGADPARVFFVEAVQDEKGNTTPFDPARDVPELAAAMHRIGGAALLIVDPIVSAVGGDMHKASDVRRSLQPLVNLAMQEGCAVLGITHFSKGSVGSSPQDRVIGSQAFGALARTVLVAAKQEGDEARVLARAKSNISIDTGGVAYTVQGATLPGGISTTRVEWGGVIEGTARDLLGSIEQQCGGDAPDGEPVDALRHVLQGDRVEAGRAKRALNASGFSEKQIRTARERLNVVSEREGFGSDMKTYWKLPNTP